MQQQEANLLFSGGPTGLMMAKCRYGLTKLAPMTYPDLKLNAKQDLVIAGGDIGVLIAHPIGGTPEDCRDLAIHLAGRGHSIYCPLLLGHGGSQRLLSATTWQHWRATLSQAQVELSQSCEKIVSCGYMTGTLLALDQAHLHSPLATVLCTPAVWPPGWFAGPLASMALLTRLKPIANYTHLHEEPPFGLSGPAAGPHTNATRREVKATAPTSASASPGYTAGVILELQRLWRHISPRLGTITCQTMICRPNDGIDRKLSEFLQRSLAGRTELLLLENSGYRVLQDRQRTLACELIADFIAAANGEPVP